MNRLILGCASTVARLLPMPAKRALYRFPPLAGWIRHQLNQAAPAGLSTASVAAGDLAGARLKLDMQAEKDYWLGTYEPELQAAIRDWVRPGMVVYDIGANIGYTSLLLARAAGPQGKVFAFEALPDNLQRLAENLALNGMEARVTVVPGGVMDRPGAVRFLPGPSGGTGKVEGSAGRRELDYRAAITVQGIVLDEFVYQHGNPAPQAIKMDIEGGEILALQGMSRLLQEASPLMFLELHGEVAARSVWNGLTSKGYKIYRMSPGYPEVPSVEVLDWKAYVVARADRTAD